MVEYWGSWLKPPIRHSYRGYPILTPHFWRVCQICLAESTLWLFEIAMENQHFRWIIELNRPWLPVCKLLNYQKGYISLFYYISSTIPYPICFPKNFLRFSWENNNITMVFWVPGDLPGPAPGPFFASWRPHLGSGTLVPNSEVEVVKRPRKSTSFCSTPIWSN